MAAFELCEKARLISQALLEPGKVGRFEMTATDLLTHSG
jgi:hypothetical protein